MSVTTGLLEPFGWGLGYPDWVDPSAPAAGTNLSLAVGGENYIRVLAARCSVSTDANVANRLVSLDYINARGVTYCRNTGSVLVTANTSGQAFEWNSHRTLAEWATGTPVFAPLAPYMLPPAFKIQITLDNIQVGDQVSAVHLWIERFPTGERGLPTGQVTEAQYLLEQHGVVIEQ